MNEFSVYILKCNDDSYYTGHTDDIQARVSLHKLGKGCSYTRKRLPVEVVFVQDFPTRDEAFNAERRIKGWTRKKKEALIQKNWNKLCELAKKKF